MSACVVQLYTKYVGRKALYTVCQAIETQRTVDGVTTPVERRIGIQIPITILNVRMVYGREHVLIRPLRGVGTVWVEATKKIVIVEEWPKDDASAPNVEGPID